jgi:hypothetical protein
VLSRIKAQVLLAECRGDEIWSPELCREKGIPEIWIEELSDAFESGFQSDRETIYRDQGVTNQYLGVRDLHLAYRLAEYLGADAKRATEMALGREAEVRALQEAVQEL